MANCGPAERQSAFDLSPLMIIGEIDLFGLSVDSRRLKIGRGHELSNHGGGMLEAGKQIIETLRAQIAQIEAKHQDRAVVLIESPSRVAVSSMRSGGQLQKHLLERLALHPDGTIWFNTVPGTRANNSGVWSPSTMQIGVSDMQRNDLPRPAPERVQVTGIPDIIAALAEWAKGNNSITAQEKAALERSLQQFGFISLNVAGRLALTVPGHQELKTWGLA